jgi:hypothetical protein
MAAYVQVVRNDFCLDEAAQKAFLRQLHFILPYFFTSPGSLRASPADADEHSRQDGLRHRLEFRPIPGD